VFPQVQERVAEQRKKFEEMKAFVESEAGKGEGRRNHQTSTKGKKPTKQQKNKNSKQKRKPDSIDTGSPRSDGGKSPEFGDGSGASLCARYSEYALLRLRLP